MLQGAVAGLAATVPMSIVMVAIHRLLPWRERRTLEPKKISDDMLRRVGLDDDLSESGREKASVAAHFGYGSACGIGYALSEPLSPLPRGGRGPAFGLLVWAASYGGWLPALGTLPPPTRYPLARQAMLVVSHLVWGAAVEAVQQRMMRGNGSAKPPAAR
jgi:uncharacterized membrane protein YagU involved in acid resistance